ncbi:hypothetical protein NYR55_05650 [Sphingomonas sp. BGYR3]|uniref:hypothetical protein n=1 Tax=Sphingomonas sp. BGYR3 TaxID=2975483 RepID=UPI0021A37870|nr:hypothetical protein [Sphingomonas sp. BGYR3]MDG5488104.1 hypothetical protein [Sphingomonas sp. BGYR3]
MAMKQRRLTKGRTVRMVAGVIGVAVLAGTLAGSWIASDLRDIARPPRFASQPALAELGTAEAEEARYRRAVADGTLVDRRQTQHWTGLRPVVREPAVQPAFTRADYETEPAP